MQLFHLDRGRGQLGSKFQTDPAYKVDKNAMVIKGKERRLMESLTQERC